MGRKDIFVEGEYYRLYHHGIDNRVVFEDEEDHLRFIGSMYLSNSGEPIHRSDYRHSTLEHIFKIPKTTSLIAIGAYVLMPNKFELIVHESSEGGVSKFMQKLLTGYTMYFNTKNSREGQLFAGRFKADLLKSDSELLQTYSHIHTLPLTLPQVLKSKKYLSHEARKDLLIKFPYSSLPDYLGNIRPQGGLLTPTAFPSHFDKAKNTLDTIVREGILSQRKT